jgi:hypothetical protein
LGRIDDFLSRHQKPKKRADFWEKYLKQRVDSNSLHFIDSDVAMPGTLKTKRRAAETSRGAPFCVEVYSLRVIQN